MTLRALISALLLSASLNGIAAAQGSPPAAKPSKVDKKPLRRQSTPTPKPAGKDALRQIPEQERSRVAPAPLQPPMDVENPANTHSRRFGGVLDNMEYDYLYRFHLGFAFSLIALDYRVVSPRDVQGGLNTSDIANAYVNLSSIVPAFGVSGLIDIHINQFFSFRLQLGPILGSKDLTFWGVNTASPNGYETMRLESIIIEMPVLLKYKALRISNWRPYIIAGLTPNVNVAAMGKFSEEKGIYVSVRPFDLHLNVGMGMDFYFQNFKMGIEAKYTTGFMDNITKDVLRGYEQYPASIQSAIAHSFVLTVLFDG